jgi:hypothetical protein
VFIGPVPKGQGVLKVLEYLANMVDYDECVKEALEYLLELSKSEGGLNLDPRYDTLFPDKLLDSIEVSMAKRLYIC